MKGIKTIAVIVFMALLIGLVWYAAKKPFVITKRVETNIHTVVKEVLPISEYASLVYSYSSVITRQINSFGILNSKKMLYVMDGTIKLGFDCKDILIEERNKNIILKMPTIRILSHEQDTANAKVYDESYSLFNVRFSAIEMLQIQTDHKEQEEEKIRNNEALFTQARASAEQMFGPLLGNLPGVKDVYKIGFEWE
ncbi:hypothetical protein AGMMS49944_21220 [Spirochaetia bacterium]|nr:hypothetical protein AGMMS49944_21220 [Spirochaetia bacterium]